MKVCAWCGTTFPSRMLIDGKMRVLSSRRFCTDCSPFGAHNSSIRPLVDPRVRRLESWVNYSRRRRVRIKVDLVAALGGRCEDCGYRRTASALEFRHRDPKTTDLVLSGFLGSIEPAYREAEKCALRCANCHRVRHALAKSCGDHPVAVFRRNLKRRAVAAAGGACRACGCSDPVDALDFHPLDPPEKELAFGDDGVPRSWKRVEAELAKGVLLCSNCHREMYADVRYLGEPELQYPAA